MNSEQKSCGNCYWYLNKDVCIGGGKVEVCVKNNYKHWKPKEQGPEQVYISCVGCLSIKTCKDMNCKINGRPNYKQEPRLDADGTFRMLGFLPVKEHEPKQGKACEVDKYDYCRICSNRTGQGNCTMNEVEPNLDEYTKKQFNEFFWKLCALRELSDNKDEAEKIMLGQIKMFFAQKIAENNANWEHKLSVAKESIGSECANSIKEKQRDAVVAYDKEVFPESGGVTVTLEQLKALKIIYDRRNKVLSKWAKEKV